MASNLGEPSCGTCKDLETYSLKISMADLSQSVGRQCDSCQFLQTGISHFVTDVDSVNDLEIFVDSSLFVTLRGEDNKAIGTVEFYTLSGKRPACQCGILLLI